MSTITITIDRPQVGDTKIGSSIIRPTAQRQAEITSDALHFLVDHDVDCPVGKETFVCGPKGRLSAKGIDGKVYFTEATAYGCQHCGAHSR